MHNICFVFTCSSVHDILSETIIEDKGVTYTILDGASETTIEDKGVTYTILDGASQKSGMILVTSIGYAYKVKVVNTMLITSHNYNHIRCN